ncbi:unnamed protein product [Rotaria magnacalcarata]|uniref:Uncharacterized protein n=1 Tax=Rotaria magnacalcarata TaxID=392030 RepID=A0A8S2N5R6_9BILA|nr:unnamed protein product [Rotaria magnacalcarata]CAF3999489.1 unnamed protein product [Rotaria magnacalcarata]
MKKKYERLKEIIKFIQNKLLPSFDEDLVLKCFRQNNSSSNDKDIQIIKNDMEKRRMCLCDLSPNNDDQSGYLTNVLKSLQKHIDINDEKLGNLFYKYYSIRNFMVVFGNYF